LTTEPACLPENRVLHSTPGLSQQPVCSVSRCRSDNSPGYRGRLKLFIARFGERWFPEITPSDLTKCFQEAGRWPDGTLKSNDTRRGNITAFQRLQTWAIEQKELSEAILERIEKPPAGRHERILTPANPYCESL